MLPVLAAGPALLSASGVDLSGIAAIITSLTGLVATLAALFVRSKQKSSDISEELVKQLLAREMKRLEKDE